MSFCGSPAYLPPEILRKAGHTLNADWYQLGVLLYEMLTGAPPYFSPIREVMLKSIEKGKLTFPKWVSEVARDLISKLMIRDTKTRLGSGENGVEEIKNHPFFQGIDWNDVLLRKLKPPLPRIYRPRTQTFTREKIYGNMAKAGQMLEDWSFISTPQ
jgi:serine/threonine protein kinase